MSRNIQKITIIRSLVCLISTFYLKLVEHWYWLSTVTQTLSLVPIKTCKKSTENHLSQLQSCSEPNFDLPEGLLILYRSGILTVDSYALNLLICPKHRDELGTHWIRRQRTCQSPFHKGKAKADRGIQATSCIIQGAVV